MNEITRIHIAKTAYDIEVAAKKQLEKYIKSLEAYTPDKEVLADIEIRMTELLTERGVKAGGVISSDDVAAIRSQLGEPYEFADGEGDIAVGSTEQKSNRRFYRSPDNAVLGGVLAGIALYFNVNPVWTRLMFVLLLFVSFGFASVLYVLLWIILPPARTVSEKLRLVGKEATVESIRELNIEEEKAQEYGSAPVLLKVLSIVLGAVSALGATLTLIGTIWLAVAALISAPQFLEMTNGFTGLGEGGAWIAWLVFSIVIFGLLLLTALLGLIAYALFIRKLSKRVLVSSIIIAVLGITSVAAAIGISTTQSWRVANETRSMMRETKANLPKEFSSVTSVKLSTKALHASGEDTGYFDQYASVRYVVDEGPARYELNALPNAKVVAKASGEKGEITLEVPSGYRNAFVQPLLTVYGPVLQAVSTDAGSGGSQISYNGTTQSALTVDMLRESTSISVAGSYEKVTVTGAGSVELGESSISVLDVNAKQGLSVFAGTVRELSVSLPDVCPSGMQSDATTVRVYGVTSGAILYNGVSLPVASHETGCASVIIEPTDDTYSY